MARRSIRPLRNDQLEDLASDARAPYPVRAIAAELGKPRSLDWWYAAALALGVDPHEIDERLASIR